MTFEDGLLGARGGLVPHEDADFIELLPFAIESEEGANFEKPGGNVEGAGDFGPVLEIFQALPIFVAVINNEKLAAGFKRFGHKR